MSKDLRGSVTADANPDGINQDSKGGSGPKPKGEFGRQQAKQDKKDGYKGGGQIVARGAAFKDALKAAGVGTGKVPQSSTQGGARPFNVKEQARIASKEADTKSTRAGNASAATEHTHGTTSGIQLHSRAAELHKAAAESHDRAARIQGRAGNIKAATNHSRIAQFHEVKADTHTRHANSYMG
jgi:hypothetical protein